MEYILIPTLFYLPVIATIHICPAAGILVSTGYLAYHYWTRRITEEIFPPMDIDTVEVTRWDPMEVIKDD